MSKKQAKLSFKRLKTMGDLLKRRDAMDEMKRMEAVHRDIFNKQLLDLRRRWEEDRFSFQKDEREQIGLYVLATPIM